MGSIESFLNDLSETDVRLVWKYCGGNGQFPGRIAGIVRMVQGVGRTSRRALARFFASLAPHSAVIAVVTLLRYLMASKPACARIPLPVPLRMSSQLRRATVAPARGSPAAGGSLQGDRPPD